MGGGREGGLPCTGLAPRSPAPPTNGAPGACAPAGLPGLLPTDARSRCLVPPQCTGAAAYYLACPKAATGAQLRFNDKMLYCDW